MNVNGYEIMKEKMVTIRWISFDYEESGPGNGKPFPRIEVVRGAGTFFAIHLLAM